MNKFSMAALASILSFPGWNCRRLPFADGRRGDQKISVFRFMGSGKPKGREFLS
jgi:hypothetical protein